MKGLFLSIYSGAGIGLLIGVLMGLALSPTVGIIIGALASALAVLLGLNDKHFSQTKAARIGSFGFACVLGALLGIFIRVNSLLAPDIQTQYQHYRDVGYSPEESRAFLAYERFGILDKNWKMHRFIAADSSGQGNEIISGTPLAQLRNIVGLYASESESGGPCDELNSLNEKSTLPYILEQMELQGGVWERLALSVEKEVAPPHQKKVLLSIIAVLCGESDIKISSQDCEHLNNRASGQQTASQLLQEMQEVGGVWKSFAEMIRMQIPAGEQSTVAKILIRSICHDE